MVGSKKLVGRMFACLTISGRIVRKAGDPGGVRKIRFSIVTEEKTLCRV
jgi:hypothetical protein